MLAVSFKVIDYGSVEYAHSLVLRQKILYQPFKRHYSSQQLEYEQHYIHIAGFIKEELCACVILIPHHEQFKIQELTVDTKWQNRGIGSALLQFCEEYALTHRFIELYTEVNETFRDFFVKNSYSADGKPFIKNYATQIKMRKVLAARSLG